MSQEESQNRQTLTSWLRQATLPLVDGFARWLIRLGASPNTLTAGGLILAAASGLLAAWGEYLWAGIALAVAAPFDALDGAVARAGGRVSRFGALLDSTLDRYGEAFVLTGLGYHLSRRGESVGVLLAFAALFGSLMVSYLRARSEGLGIDNKIGLFTRLERTVVLILMLLTGQVIVGLWVLAVLTHVTVAQRVAHARILFHAQCRAKESSE